MLEDRIYLFQKRQIVSQSNVWEMSLMSNRTYQRDQYSVTKTVKNDTVPLSGGK